MKKTLTYYVLAGLCVLLGVLVAMIPNYLLPVCDLQATYLNHPPMACYYSARAELGLGVLLALEAVLLFWTKSKESTRMVACTLIFTAILSLLVPSYLIGGCLNPQMSCQKVTFPSLYLVLGIELFILLLLLLQTRKQVGED